MLTWVTLTPNGAKTENFGELERIIISELSDVVLLDGTRHNFFDIFLVLKYNFI